MSQKYTQEKIEENITSLDKMLKGKHKIIGHRVRNIDLFIHRWDKPDCIQDDISDFLLHQLKIITITNEYQIEIFNDTSVYNGETGTMTDVLRACYFSLYSILLNNGLKINLEKDFNIIISLLFGIRYNEDEDKIILPLTEFTAIKQIIKNFKELNPDHKFNELWWSNLKESLATIYIEILPKWSYWNENPDKRSSKVIWGRLPLTIKSTFKPGIWEKHPCYIIHFDDNLDFDINKTLRRIEYLEALFNDPDSKMCIDISNCSTDILGGGNYFNKYIKYKNKYLLLSLK